MSDLWLQGELVNRQTLNKKAQITMPSGGIIMWSGAVNAIPTGWALCNGANGTPDLRDRFVVGAGNTYAVGVKGGETTHTLTVAEMPAHAHNLTGNSKITIPLDRDNVYGGNFAAGNSGGQYYDKSTLSGISVSSVGGGLSHENRPPYYALCYIMRL